MNKSELLEYVKRFADKANNAVLEMHTTASIGFAIPVPSGVSEADMGEVDTELVKLCWSFERVEIRGKQYYVLFPLG